jgi:WRKY transcription factor 2
MMHWPNKICTVQSSSVTHQNETSASDIDHRIPESEPEVSEANRNGDYSSAPIIAHAEDGYNWRKYGKRQVKNSDHPTSYYKCTHHNCPVKKKVERGQDGDITEIVYKGSHNHPLPPPDSRPGGPENVPNDHFQNIDGEVGTKLSVSLYTEEPADTSEAQEIIDVSSSPSNEDVHREIHGIVSLGFDGDEDATKSKRRLDQPSDYLRKACCILINQCSLFDHHRLY